MVSEYPESPAARRGLNHDFPRTFAGVVLDRPRIMGIINVTPDSFSDGGDLADARMAIRHGERLLSEGADILDIGGESTRPGADAVTIDEELRRVLPVVRALAPLGAPVSIDTRRAAVMEAALDAGATIVNDVTALTGDERSLDVVAASTAGVVLMHMKGDPGTMQNDPRYGDVVAEVRDYLSSRVEACAATGIDRTRIAVDPGIGFGKTLDHNLRLLADLRQFDFIGCPVLLGVSRKSFIARICGDIPPKARFPGSIAAALAGVAAGAAIIRVHDVGETRQALSVWSAITKSSAGD